MKPIILALAAITLLSCSSRDPVRTIGVHAEDFDEPTRYAMKLINGWTRCDFLVPGKDVVVKSSDGEPCGDAWRPKEEQGHSATAYRCPAQSLRRWEIHVERPGDLHTQLCIVAHELGHVAGLKDGTGGIMNQYECPEFVRLTDAQTDYLRGVYCK